MVTSPTSGINQAINAYQSAAKAADAERSEAAQGAGGDEFAQLVRGAIDEAVRIGERSEQLSIDGIHDRADISEVVTAVAEAEVTLQTVVTIRDKVIDAYREILRMPI